MSFTPDATFPPHSRRPTEEHEAERAGGLSLGHHPGSSADLSQDLGIVQRVDGVGMLQLRAGLAYRSRPFDADGGQPAQQFAQIVISDPGSVIEGIHPTFPHKRYQFTQALLFHTPATNPRRFDQLVPPPTGLASYRPVLM